MSTYLEAVSSLSDCILLPLYWATATGLTLAVFADVPLPEFVRYSETTQAQNSVRFSFSMDFERRILVTDVTSRG
uniref:Uncharacterized protein n=1 Tax=Tetraselmis sp. GSL018 TaxID=582737 RepID=A0A061RY61_9CHLO